MGREAESAVRERVLELLREHEEKYGSSRRDLMYIELVSELSASEIDEVISKLLEEGIVSETETGELKRVT
nr:hypothetical protein [Candidatus Freyarchaeota archaeon]